MMAQSAPPTGFDTALLTSLPSALDKVQRKEL